MRNQEWERQRSAKGNWPWRIKHRPNKTLTRIKQPDFLLVVPPESEDSVLTNFCVWCGSVVVYIWIWCSKYRGRSVRLDQVKGVVTSTPVTLPVGFFTYQDFGVFVPICPQAWYTYDCGYAIQWERQYICCNNKDYYSKNIYGVTPLDLLF